MSFPYFRDSIEIDFHSQQLPAHFANALMTYLRSSNINRAELLAVDQLGHASITHLSLVQGQTLEIFQLANMLSLLSSLAQPAPGYARTAFQAEEERRRG